MVVTLTVAMSVVRVGRTVSLKIHWHLVADVHVGVLNWFIPFLCVGGVVGRNVMVRLSGMVQVALWVVFVVDGSLVPLYRLNISLCVITVVKDFVFWLVELVGDSMLVSVGGWHVVAAVGPVEVGMLPLIVMNWLVVSIVFIIIVVGIIVIVSIMMTVLRLLIV